LRKWDEQEMGITKIMANDEGRACGSLYTASRLYDITAGQECAFLVPSPRSGGTSEEPARCRNA